MYLVSTLSIAVPVKPRLCVQARRRHRRRLPVLREAALRGVGALRNGNGDREAEVGESRTEVMASSEQDLGASVLPGEQRHCDRNDMSLLLHREDSRLYTATCASIHVRNKALWEPHRQGTRRPTPSRLFLAVPYLEQHPSHMLGFSGRGIRRVRYRMSGVSWGCFWSSRGRQLAQGQD